MANDDNYWQHSFDESGASQQGNVPAGMAYQPPAQQVDPPAAGSAASASPASAQQIPHASAARPAMPDESPYHNAMQPPYAAPQPAYGTADTPAPKSHAWIVVIVIVLVLAVITVHSINSCSSAIGAFHGSSASALDALTDDAVGVIYIDGTIQYDNSACSPEGLKELLDKAEDNSHIKAVVLRVNSGGGTATAGEEMAEYVKQFSKPIVVSSASINASAAYEISSQADYIYVAKSTEIGAIGTAMELMDLSGLFEMLGVSMETITSSDSKDSSYGYRALTDEERAYYQEMINQINETFIQAVAEGRGMDVEDVRALATGMPFTGITSVKNGLADEVGTREDAIDKAAELGGITGSYSTVNIDFDYDYDLSSLYYLLGSSSSRNQDLADALGLDSAGAHIR